MACNVCKSKLTFNKRHNIHYCDTCDPLFPTRLDMHHALKDAKVLLQNKDRLLTAYRTGKTNLADKALVAMDTAGIHTWTDIVQKHHLENI